MAEHMGDGQSTDYKKTLNLPHTDFPLRAQASMEDPRILSRWTQENIYDAAMECNSGKKTFILHDGPPYANGHLHLGHAYNKILKDIITKAYRMAGYHVPIQPGWDCHGLPIELKVTKEQPGLNPDEIMNQCRKTAAHWMQVQCEEFRKLGVVMDWNHPYSTMDFSYESSILRAFSIFIKKEFITRNFKTVAWCPSCETTLAAAEIEYQDRKDPSIFVLFPLTRATIAHAFPAYASADISMLVWTTTPWTLPLNRAVAVKPQAEYVLISSGEDEHKKYLVVGRDALQSLSSLLQKEFTIIDIVPSSVFEQGTVHHPIVVDTIVPIIFDDNVGVEEGTACVHIAPGCGPSDYELGVRYGLEIYSPITPKGLYTSNIIPVALQGMSVADGQGWVIKELERHGLLFHKTSLRHSYPHCWRCRNGLIYRATRQWFLNLKQQGLQEKALQAVDQIFFVPERSSNFLRATVANRWEWCLSRQRIWGVPIPALLCTACDAPYMTPEWVEHVAKRVAQEGIEFWRKVPVKELADNIRCATCAGCDWRKETDILDVWFESGVSHYAVLVPQGIFPADLYLEGVDQHRAWFQSSLLTALVVEDQPPMRGIMSHGFTVDDQGRKMSKSLGNVVQPQELVDKLGTDGVRLWVSSIDHESDVVVSSVLLDHVTKVYLKIRNTARFFLQNLANFNDSSDAISYESLLYIDALALSHFAEFHELMKKKYLAYDMTAIFHGLSDYCTVQLSAVYCDLLKDRLYVAAAAGRERRSAQTVLWRMLDASARLMAPILSFTAEHIAEYYCHPWKGSIHLQLFDDLGGSIVSSLPSQGAAIWDMLQGIRSFVMKLLEAQRAAGVIKHSLQASVDLIIAPDYRDYALFAEFLNQAQARGEDPTLVLQELLVVSQVKLLFGAETAHQSSRETINGLWGRVEHAQGVKCPRCWKWQLSHHADGLCDRCSNVIRQLNEQ
jgi:isoleucyl-tRNA synthetase